MSALTLLVSSVLKSKCVTTEVWEMMQDNEGVNMGVIIARFINEGDHCMVH